MSKLIILLRILLAILFIFINQKGITQTALIGGDLAFTGYIGNGTAAGTDQFSFILLKDITNNTIVKFTDDAWLKTSPSTGSFGNTEGTMTWTSNAAYPIGTEINILVNGTTAMLKNGLSAGSISSTSLLSFSTNGDQIIAYQGTTALPTFIMAIHMNVYANGIPAEPITNSSVWDGNYFTVNSSGLPTGLTTGVNAIWIGIQGNLNSEFDNAYFNCIGSLSTVSEIKSAIYNQANWITSNNIPGFSLPTQCNVLPVEFLFINASKTENGNEITWATSSEVNNKGYYIEYSVDGNFFEELGYIEGSENSQEINTYTYLDETYPFPVVYYRLRQVDFDGNFEYSPLVFIENDEMSQIKIFSNSNTGDIILENVRRYSIFNLYGQNVKLEIEEKKTNISISSLENGLYLIHAEGLNGTNVLKKVLIFHR